MEECLTVVYTHNLQDYSEDTEPADIRECRRFPKTDFPEEFVSKVKGGYTAVVTLNQEVENAKSK